MSYQFPPCVVRMIFGSHLYGTSTESSDRDYKGIFLPSREQILLQRVPKSISTTTKEERDRKNTAEDEDLELYSLGYFLELASKGETVALDMLHAPERAWEYADPDGLWRFLVEHRSWFYTKNLKALVGYARRQAAKYGVKGSRLADAETVFTWLTSLPPEDRLAMHWGKRPKGEHLMDVAMPADPGPLTWDVCGRKIQSTVRVAYAASVIKDFIESYGARARMAKENSNIDWKAVSHAFRAGYQVRAILRERDFTYPLKETDFLLAVKRGELDYLSEVAPRLDTLLEQVEDLSRNSELPEKVDRAFWDHWLLGIYEGIVRRGAGRVNAWEV